MQDTYLHMQGIYANMQDINVNMQDKKLKIKVILRVYIVSASDISSFNMQYTNVNMQDNYVNMQLFMLTCNKLIFHVDIKNTCRHKYLAC